MLQEATDKLRGVGRGRASCTRPQSHIDPWTSSWQPATGPWDSQLKLSTHNGHPYRAPFSECPWITEERPKLCPNWYTTFQLRTRDHEVFSTNHQTLFKVASTARGTKRDRRLSEEAAKWINKAKYLSKLAELNVHDTHVRFIDEKWKDAVKQTSAYFMPEFTHLFCCLSWQCCNFATYRISVFFLCHTAINVC